MFLDYDGTLTPIVEDHTRALLADDMRAAVAALASALRGDHRQRPRPCETAGPGRPRSLSGTRAAMASEIAGGPARLRENTWNRARRFLSELDEAVERALRERLAGIGGHSVERKKFSIAVHYRQVARDDVGKLRPVLDKTLTEHPGLRLGHGKKVFEIRPDIDWDKGEAVLWLLRRLGPEQPGPAPLYVGDDITDEDAFHVLAGARPVHRRAGTYEVAPDRGGLRG
ncbi:MAG: trehalose-phosphatase [Halioglobus sp.]|nr:trehalose-phosphatase [Halioglobus sp.]